MRVGDLVAGRFAIRRAIGRGGMGSVYLATDQLDGANVAVKVVDVVHAGAAERFSAEARMLSDLSHPGIVRYIAHGVSEARERKNYSCAGEEGPDSRAVLRALGARSNRWLAPERSGHRPRHAARAPSAFSTGSSR